MWGLHFLTFYRRAAILKCSDIIFSSLFPFRCACYSLEFYKVLFGDENQYLVLLLAPAFLNVVP